MHAYAHTRRHTHTKTHTHTYAHIWLIALLYLWEGRPSGQRGSAEHTEKRPEAGGAGATAASR